MAVNKCIKFLLFFFNFLFWLSGCLILAAAIYLKVSKNGNQITNAAVPGVNVLIAVGVIIMVLGFLGCCGAIRENRCMLLLFFIGLLLIFILLLAAGILGAIGNNKATDQIKADLSNLMPLSSQPADIQSDIQSLQQEGKCCGLINGSRDWGNSVPASCNCKDMTAPCQNVGGQNVYSTPCITYVINVMKSNLKVVLGIAFAIAVLLILGMVFSMILYCQIGKGTAPIA